MRHIRAQNSLPRVRHVRLGCVDLEVLAGLALRAFLFLSVAAMLNSGQNDLKLV